MRKIFLFLVPLLLCVFTINAQNFNVEKNAAISLVSASKATLGLSTDDLSNVMVSSAYYDNTSSVTRVYLIQTHKGIPVYNQMLVLAFKGDKLVSQAGAFNHSMEKFINVKSGMPSVSAESAVQSALSDRGLRATQMAVALNRKNNGQQVEFSNMGISRENITAQLMWSPVENSNEMNLAWQVYIIPKTTSDYWMVRVDAVNNRILGIDNYTDYDHWGTPDVHASSKYPAFALADMHSNTGNKIFLDFKQAEDPDVVNTATYRVVPYPAEAPSFPNGAHALRTDPWLAAPGNATTLKWNTGLAATDYNYTRGNNVWAYEDRANSNAGSVAKSASSSTALPNLTFDFTPNYTVDPTQTTPVPNQQFNITNLFYWNNVIHDIMYIYGMDEVGGNFQDDNLGRGGAGNDHVNAEAQDGGGTNNANFATPADGGSGRMQMYLWTGGTPNRDGDVDNGIIVHEYGHGISNRLTGGPAASGCLGNAEQMGEGWSDYYGLMFTQDWATATLNTGFNSPRGIGTYALFQPPTGLGIRGQRYCTDFTVNNRVYLASLPTGPHPRGEIWCATLWDMTWNIINQIGTINPNLYNLAGGGGNTIAMKLVTEGLKLQQCSPGFISGRNAILQADQNLYGGLYNCAIWEAFRRRGMGAFASEGSTASVTDQIPDFTPPITMGATVSATTIPEGSNLVYTNSVTTCSALSGYTLRDTLPTNVTHVSGGIYDAGTRVVSFTVNQAAGTTNYPFTVNVNPGSYFPPVSLFNETVATTTIPAAWTTTASPGNVWTVSTTVSNSAPNSFFVENLAVAGDQRLARTASVALPVNSYPELSFWHRFNTEDGWDGGVVEVSTNGGTTWLDLGPQMTLNGYNGGLGAAPTNALSGRSAFTGLQGTFINTKINLAPYNGTSIMIRFRFGSDDNTTAPTTPAGWWVDDITLGYKAAVNMRTSLFNASNTRVSFKDNVTEITQLVACNPTITQQPANAAVCAGTSVDYTCLGTAVGGVTYQWQLSTTGIGGAYTNLTNGAPYAGVTTSTLTVNPTVVGMNGYYFRCVVTGTCAPTVTSNPALLSVAAASTPGAIAPATSQVCGTTNSGTLTLSGHIGSILRWESATNLAGPWTAIANTSATYVYNNLTQTTHFRAVVQFGTCVAANSATATVNFVASAPLSIVANPGTTLCAGDPTLLTVMQATGPVVPGTVTTTFTNNNQFALVTSNFRNNNPFAVTITGIESVASTSGASTARLYVKTSPVAGAPGAITAANGWNLVGSGTYTATANTTTTTPQTMLTGLTLVIPAGATYGIAFESQLTAGAGNLRYSTVAAGTYTNSGGGCDLVSGTNVSYAGNLAPLAPTFTPRAFIGRVNFESVSLGPVTTGTFLWSPAAGLSSTTSNPVAASPMQTTTYTVNHDNGAGCVRQANITITVNTRPAVTAQPANTSVCSGTSATFTVGAVATGILYQWQVSTNGGTTYTNITAGAPYSGETTNILTINPTTTALNGYMYRCVISGICPPAANSNGATLTVVSLPTVSISPTGPVCGGVAGISGTALTASGANTYVWTPNGAGNGLYTNATATTVYTGSNLATVYAAPTAFTAYTVTGTSTSTGCSNTATVLVNYTPPAPSVVPTSVTMCLGDAAVRLVASSSTTTAVSFPSGTISVPIPDNTQAGATSTITVAGIPAAAAIGSMNVNFNMSHTWAGDIVMAIKAPNNNVLNLNNQLSGTGGAAATTGFVNTTISSAGTAALSSGTGTYTGTFRADALAGAAGGPTGMAPTGTTWAQLYSVPNGIWTLGVYDNFIGDVGTLTSWTINMTYVLGVPSTAAVWTPAAGLFNDALASSPYVAGTRRDTVWTRPTPAGVYPYMATVNSLPPPAATPITNFATGNGQALVTFNVRNNNGYQVTLTDIASAHLNAGTATVTAFYKPSAINGLPGAISAANGWIQFGTGTANIPTAATITPSLTGLSLVVPAGATYGIAFQSLTAANVANASYSTLAAGTYTFSSGGCDIISGTNIGYGGVAAPGAPTFTPRGFIGSLSMVAGFPACTSPARTVVVTVNQPTTLNAALPVNQTVCTDKVATFAVAITAGTGPHSYQWQVSTNAGNTYTNVSNGGVYSGATSATLTITAPPVTMSGYLYRCVVTGAAPCAPVTSFQRELRVNPLPVVIISANPTSLFPGLTTTITSSVTPNAASTYTWTRNGATVAGASSGTLNVDVDGLGVYQLRVTDVNGCTSSSNLLTIKDSVSAKCFIYPNPASGKFQVRYYSVANNILPRSLTIFDAKGDRVLTQMYTIGRPYDRMDVDMRAFGKGLYWVEIGDHNGSRLTMCRVVIQ